MVKISRKKKAAIACFLFKSQVYDNNEPYPIGRAFMTREVNEL